MRTLVLTIILTTVTIIGYGQNLISNWKFQDNTMEIQCVDWYDGCGNELSVSCDTIQNCYVSFYNQSPSVLPEDVWSLQLDGDFPWVGLAETYITGQNGTQVYQLKYWMKSEPYWSGYTTGYASIGTGSQNQFTASKTMSDTASVWKQITLTDTLTTLAADTITVRLSAQDCDFCLTTVYFDFIELTVIEILASIGNINNENNSIIKTYPNPSKEWISFEISSNKVENHKLKVYNSTGQLIKACQMINNILTLDIGNIESGLYFYQIQRMTDPKIIGHGKFIKE